MKRLEHYEVKMKKRITGGGKVTKRRKKKREEEPEKQDAILKGKKKLEWRERIHF